MGHFMEGFEMIFVGGLMGCFGEDLMFCWRFNGMFWGLMVRCSGICYKDFFEDSGRNVEL